MDTSTKIKMAMVATQTTQVELARRSNQLQSSLSQKLKDNNFRVNELESLVNLLGCKLELNIVLPDGRKI